jgi:hypothetical protein
MVPEAQTYTLWLAGTGFHGIDGADFTTEQCVTQRGFADAGFPHNANHGFIRDQLVEFLRSCWRSVCG